MLGRLIQARAISSNDQGMPGEDAFRAEIAARSCFVLDARRLGRVAIAGFLATILAAGSTTDFSADLRIRAEIDRRLVSPPLAGCAHGVAGGGETGSHPASLDAPGFGSHCQTVPEGLRPGRRGGLA